MEKFIQDISTVYWWLGVVLVGIVINLMSGYLKKFIEKYINKFSDSRLKAKQNYSESFHKKVEILSRSESLKILYSNSETNLRVRSLVFLTTSMFSFVLANNMMDRSDSLPAYLFLLLSVATILMGMADHKKSMEIKELISASTPELQDLN